MHPDPELSARILPTYALRINIREGWTMMSDIGHRFRSHWAHQCEPCNPVHPRTRTFSHRAGLTVFLNNYRACCQEYYDRTGKMTCWQQWFADIDTGFWINVPADQEQETLRYLTNYKSDKMTPEELITLKGGTMCATTMT